MPHTVGTRGAFIHHDTCLHEYAKVKFIAVPLVDTDIQDQRHGQKMKNDDCIVLLHVAAVTSSAPVSNV